MADPISWAALALAAAGTATSVVGQVEAGNAQASAARYQAQVARNNAVVADQSATYAVQAGEAQAQQQSQKGAAQIARIKTAQAASGLDVNKGSAVDVRAGQAETNKLDTLNVMNNALLRAYGYKTQQSNETAQAGLDEFSARQAKTGATIGALGSLLSGASSVGSKWDSFKTSNGGGATIGGGGPGDSSAELDEGP